MKRRTKRNESHPHKTVICRMCVTRRSGEGGRKRLMVKQQTSEPTLCCLNLLRSTSSSKPCAMAKVQFPQQQVQGQGFCWGRSSDAPSKVECVDSVERDYSRDTDCLSTVGL